MSLISAYEEISLNENQKTTAVSIIICTKDRYEDLRKCLESVALSYSSYPYAELIVVDSTTAILLRGKIEDECRKFGAKYFYEKRKGLSIARNTGIENSFGEITVFLDDDFIVDKDCIKNLIKNFEDPDVACCTGRMLSYRNDDLSMIFEKHMSYDRGETKLVVTAKDMNFINLFKTSLSKFYDNHSKRRSVPPYSVGFGFCSFRREIFNVAGFFDTNLGRGTPQMGSDDVDIYYRILKTGCKIVYEPNALIYHNHRHTMRELINYAYSSGVSILSFTKKHYKKDPYVFALFLGNLLLTFFWLLKASIKLNQDLKAISLAQLSGYFRRLSWLHHNR